MWQMSKAGGWKKEWWVWWMEGHSTNSELLETSSGTLEYLSHPSVLQLSPKPWNGTENTGKTLEHFSQCATSKSSMIICLEFLQTLCKGSIILFTARVQSRKGGYRFPGFLALISALLKILVFYQANLLSTLSQDLVSNNFFSSFSILAQFWQLKGRLKRKKKSLNHLIGVIAYFLLCEEQ